MTSDLTYGNMSSEAVKKGTGRDWDEWLKLLDDAGAQKMSHKEIAAWLNENHIESGWWAQSVTVGYEQARGMRKRHERPDGFSVSVSKTISGAIGDLYSAWTDSAKRESWLPSTKLDYTTANENKNLRAKWPEDDSQLVVNFYDKGDSRTQVVVQLERLVNEEIVERRRKFWREALGRLAESI